MLDFIHHQIFRIPEAESNKIFVSCHGFVAAEAHEFSCQFYFPEIFLGGIFFLRNCHLSCHQRGEDIYF